MIRQSQAEWKGPLKEGTGNIKIGTALEGKYSFASRFETGDGTNPEELIGAAHAACFSMALSGILSRAGHAPSRITTIAKVHIEKVGEGFEVTQIELDSEGEVYGIDEKTFIEAAGKAKEGCPISKALKSVNIRLNARLKQV
jgi:lipoyl-dependent peroxiredoxin